MFQIIFLYVLALVWILFANIQDLRKREVANWLNFSLIIFALGFRFFYSFFSENFAFFYQGLIGLGIFFILGNLFYYGKIFAGGDAKLMIALGTILGFSNDFSVNMKIFASFLFFFFFVGAIYGLLISGFLTIINFKNFKKEFKKQFSKSKNLLFLIFIPSFILILSGFYNGLFFVLGICIFILPYFYLYAKAVDEVCMVRNIDVKKLSEGDWLYKDVKVGRNLIKANWDGLNKKQIKDIQKKYKKIQIRHGIPFVPVFLISFILLGILFYFGILDSFWNFYF